MLHYFFVASFTWMLVEAIHLFLKIVSVFNIRITRMRYYVAIGWGKFRDMSCYSTVKNIQNYLEKRERTEKNQISVNIVYHATQSID